MWMVVDWLEDERAQLGAGWSDCAHWVLYHKDQLSMATYNTIQYNTIAHTSLLRIYYVAKHTFGILIVSHPSLYQ